MWSATPVGVAANNLLETSQPFTNTYRVYIRPAASGRWRWSIFMTNAADSTWGQGPPMPNRLGGTWRIDAAYLADAGTARGGSVASGTAVRVTFGGNNTKMVRPGESFWSDPVALDLPAAHDLAFTWTITATAAGPVLPLTSAPFLTSYAANNMSIAAQDSAAGFTPSFDPLVAPHMFAYDRAITRRLCFLGDSITQGIGSGRDTYGYWVAKIAAGLGPDIGVWNLGGGWARAADAASDGHWLAKARACDEVAVILGVNDIINSNRTAGQIMADLTTIVAALKRDGTPQKVFLFTVPTFNLSGQGYTTWKQVNDWIRSAPPSGTDGMFDIAAVLSQPAPNDGQLKPAYTSGDPHPNDTAGTEIANAFISWYRAR